MRFKFALHQRTVRSEYTQMVVKLHTICPRSSDAFYIVAYSLLYKMVHYFLKNGGKNTSFRLSQIIDIIYYYPCRRLKISLTLETYGPGHGETEARRQAVHHCRTI